MEEQSSGYFSDVKFTLKAPLKDLPSKTNALKLPIPQNDKKESLDTSKALKEITSSNSQDCRATNVEVGGSANSPPGGHRTFAHFQRSLKRELRRKTEVLDPKDIELPPTYHRSLTQISSGSSIKNSRLLSPDSAKPSILKVKSLDRPKNKARRVSFSLADKVIEVECLKQYNKRIQNETPTFKERSKREQEEGCVIF